VVYTAYCEKNGSIQFVQEHIYCKTVNTELTVILYFSDMVCRLYDNFLLWAPCAPLTFTFWLPVQVFYVFKSRICNVHLVSFCIYVSFIAPVEGLCCKLKYPANIIHYFNFVFFLYFFHHSSCRKDQFTVLMLKFGTQDFTDPGLLQS